MPVRPPAPCTYVGYPPCPTLVRGGGRCPDHRTQARRDSDKARGNPAQRGYGKAHRERFRAGVLRADPYCTCTADHCSTRHPAGGPCPHPSTEADHWPISKRELILKGLDSNDPRYGVGRCQGCHASLTARTSSQRGGWNAR